MKALEIAYLGLGSNLGDREAQLLLASKALSELPKTKILAQSSWLENPAIEEAGPYDFLNTVVQIETALGPRDLLAYIREIERNIDPERDTRGRKLARKIDIDILIFGDLELDEADLQLPHPRMLERDFVMKALYEIAPDLRID